MKCRKRNRFSASESDGEKARKRKRNGAVDKNISICTLSNSDIGFVFTNDRRNDNTVDMLIL